MTEIFTKLTTNNSRVCDFFSKHSYLNFDTVCLLLVELLENILQESSISINKSISSQILQECIDNKNRLNEFQNHLTNQLILIQSNITKFNSDFTVKLFEIKKDYIEEVKSIIISNSNEKISSIIEKNNENLSNKTTITMRESVDKISQLLEKTSYNLVDKTKLILNDIFPENIEKINNFIESDINKFSLTISQDLQKIIENEKENEKYLIEIIENEKEKDKIMEQITYFFEKNKENQIEQFLSSFEIKFSSFFQSIQQPILSNLTNSEERINNKIMNISLDNDKNKIVSDKLLYGQENLNNSLIKLNNNFEDYFNRYRVSFNRGEMGENRLRYILNQMFPTGEVIDTSGQKESGYCFLRRDNFDPILFENKDYESNISPDEIKKFIRDCNLQKSHGIFLSQFSGISSKKNYHIDINKGKILVYVHKTEYHQDRIKTAIDIVDSLSEKMNEIDKNLDQENDFIPKEILEDINNEYQKFVSNKQNIMTTIKDFEKRISLQLNDLNFSSLENFLSKRYATIQKNLICDICNNYASNSLKSMALHKRACKKNIISITENIS